METVDLPFMYNNRIQAASSLFIDDNVICFPVNVNGPVFPHLHYFNKAANKEACKLLSSPFDGHNTAPVFKWHKANGQLFLFSKQERNFAINRVFYDPSSVRGILKSETIFTREIDESFKEILQNLCGNFFFDDVASFFSRSVFCLSNKMSFSIPINEYFASFTHSNRMYFLSYNQSIGAVSCEMNDTYLYDEPQREIVVDATVQQYLLNTVLKACDTHVIEDTVFLLCEKDKLFKLDLKSFQLTNVTSKVPITRDHLKFAFHKQFLYATSRTLNEALNRFDLTTLIDKEEENGRNVIATVKGAVSAECPVCLEPFQDPKVFSKCGHSICGGCEKKLSVENILLRTKTLTCPVCRVSTVIDMTESLPTNWALKSGASALSSSCTSVQRPQPTGSLRCEFCKKCLAENETFNCEFCAEKDAKLEVFVCGTCVVKGHGDHFSNVKSVKFADNAYRKQKIGHITRDPMKPEEEKTALRAEISEKADVELDAFFGKLTKDYEKVNNQVTSLMAMTSISQKAMDKAAENLVKDETAIDTKIQQLEDWKKEVYECFSKLNKHTLL